LLVPDEGIEPPTFGLQNRCSHFFEARLSFSRFNPATPPECGDMGAPSLERIFAFGQEFVALINRRHA
jgi:hypothetical protein